MSSPPVDDPDPRTEGVPSEESPRMFRDRLGERLERHHVVRLVKFSLVGGLGIVVNWGCFELGYYVLGFLGRQRAAVGAYVFGLVVSIFTNFVLNDIWTWADRDKGGVRDWLHRLGKYYVSASVAGLIQVWISSISFTWIWDPFGWQYPGGTLPGTGFEVPSFELAPRLGLLTGVAFGMVINFVASHLWAFQDAG